MPIAYFSQNSLSPKKNDDGQKNTEKEGKDVRFAPSVEDIKREMETLVMRRTNEEGKER